MGSRSPLHILTVSSLEQVAIIPEASMSTISLTMSLWAFSTLLNFMAVFLSQMLRDLSWEPLVMQLLILLQKTQTACLPSLYSQTFSWLSIDHTVALPSQEPQTKASSPTKSSEEMVASCLAEKRVSPFLSRACIWPLRSPMTTKMGDWGFLLLILVEMTSLSKGADLTSVQAPALYEYILQVLSLPPVTRMPSKQSMLRASRLWAWMTLLSLYIFQFVQYKIYLPAASLEGNGTLYYLRMRKYLKEGQYSFDEAEMIGRGSFGKVYRGYDHTNSRWVAIKAMHLEVIEFAGEEMKAIVCSEVTVMRKLADRMSEKACPYIVKHYDCFRTDTNVYLVMELCQGGTLSNLIEQNALSEGEAKNVVEQVLRGLVYLEELGICHRDLKPENIFIWSQFQEGKSEVYYKIGDFGFAAQKQTYTETLGTYPFMAPQIYSKLEYNSKVDVWSLGTIAFQLLFKELYFSGKNKWQIEKKVKEMPFCLSAAQKQEVSREMEELLTLCLTKDPAKRPKASQLLGCALFAVDESADLVIFEAIEHELMLSELLRSMAEEICDFGISANRNTQFMQIYLLKKSFASINMVAYSLTSRQNYLGVASSMLDALLSEKRRGEYEALLQKVEKESILITNVFQEKYKQFRLYISKFSGQEVEAIENVVRVGELYSDISQGVFKGELRKWMGVLEKEEDYEALRVKCEKLDEFT